MLVLLLIAQFHFQGEEELLRVCLWASQPWVGRWGNGKLPWERHALSGQDELWVSRPGQPKALAGAPSRLAAAPLGLKQEECPHSATGEV